MIRPPANLLDGFRALREMVAAWNAEHPDDGGTASARPPAVGGAGVLVAVDADGNIRLATAGKFRRYEHCKIVEVQGTTPGDPAGIRYKVRSLDAGWTTDWVAPYYGRPSAAGEFKIHACQVGDDCQVVRGLDAAGQPYARLWVMSERLARRVCS